tara:strand:+ start:249 stop:377 length:129 start_codon:yes stop_codon:yes gene_type:complete
MPGTYGIPSPFAFSLSSFNEAQLDKEKLTNNIKIIFFIINFL